MYLIIRIDNLKHYLHLKTTHIIRTWDDNNKKKKNLKRSPSASSRRNLAAPNFKIEPDWSA